MNSVAGVVILYNPDKDNVIRNITSYIDQLSELLVIDNSLQKDPDLIDKINDLQKPIKYRSNAENEGIAKPLNDAAAWAVSKGYSWLLTMDQDSYFEQHDIKEYVKWVSTDSPDDMAISGVSFNQDSKPGDLDSINFESVNKVITSGSIIRLKAWELLKGFDEKLFIDEVDHEFCYHALAKGLKVYRLKYICMAHEMGKMIPGGYFGKIYVRKRMIHSPLRIYYMVRNYCSVRKRYEKLIPEEFISRDKELKVILKNNLFFSGKFFTTLKMALKGFQDYRKGVTGKFINH